jgi:hypothetical protein
MSLEIGFVIIFSQGRPKPDIIRHIEQSTVCALPFPSAISYFKICAQMNQSLIPPFTGAEIVKATSKSKLR